VNYDATYFCHPLLHEHPALQSDNELSMPEKEGAHSFDRKKFRQVRPLLYHTGRETGDKETTTIIIIIIIIIFNQTTSIYSYKTFNLSSS
jgi:hypothetical protein